MKKQINLSEKKIKQIEETQEEIRKLIYYQGSILIAMKDRLRKLNFIIKKC